MIVPRICRTMVLCLLLTVAATVLTAAPFDVTGTYYFEDTPFPEFMNMWVEGWSLTDASGQTAEYAKKMMPLGGYAFVYLRNTTGKAVKFTDLAINGIKLSEGLGMDEPPKRAEDKFRASIYMSKLPKEKISALEDAGAPVWWKPMPFTVQPGGLAEIVLRLRRNPKSDTLRMTLITDAGDQEVVIQTNKLQPRFASITFSPSLDTVNLFVRHPKGAGIQPTKIYLDGTDVTAQCKIASDNSVDVTPIVLKLPKPLDWLSYHHFRAAYSDGSAATAGIRTWGREIVYGMWGSKSYPGTDEESVKRYTTEYVQHNINVHMDMVSGKGIDWYRSKAGWEFTESIGLGRMTNYPSAEGTSVFHFLLDEPDAHDFNTPEVPAHLRLGSLGQFCVRWNDVLQRKGPKTPVLLNIDNTYKPENWYTYHQIPDIPCIDPYYQGELDLCYTKHPARYSAHTKPTYVYAASTISQSSCAPKPLHVILCSTKYPDAKANYPGRFPTPEEARMMVYYALAAGAKGLSYWWFSDDPNCIGCGVDDPAAKILWKEIGLLGAEVRTASDIIGASCPVTLSVAAPRYLWVRTLISGVDTVAVIAVNDNVLCDRLGTVVRPVEKAKVSVQTPSWLKAADAFEITFEGIKDVSWTAGDRKVNLDLGTVNVSRFIILTSDTGLRAKLQKLYDAKFAANVRALVK